MPVEPQIVTKTSPYRKSPPKSKSPAKKSAKEFAAADVLANKTAESTNIDEPRSSEEAVDNKSKKKIKSVRKLPVALHR